MFHKCVAGSFWWSFNDGEIWKIQPNHIFWIIQLIFTHHQKPAHSYYLLELAETKHPTHFLKNKKGYNTAMNMNKSPIEEDGLGKGKALKLYPVNFNQCYFWELFHVKRQMWLFSGKHFDSTMFNYLLIYLMIFGGVQLFRSSVF